MLFVVPPLLILAGWAKGTRPGERRMVAWAALLLGAWFVPAMLWVERGGGDLAKGCAYALVVMALTCLAMLVHARPGPDDGGEGPPGDPVPEGPDAAPFDWDEFERRFWDDVRRRRSRPRVPVA